MGVRADDHVSGNGKTFFRKKGVFDSHLPHVEVIGDIVAAGKLSHALAVFCGFNILIRDKMVHYQGDLILVKHCLHCHFIHFMNRYRRSDIVSQDQIQVRFDQLSGFHMIQACMSGQDLLRHCHSHDYFLLKLLLLYCCHYSTFIVIMLIHIIHIYYAYKLY